MTKSAIAPVMFYFLSTTDVNAMAYTKLSKVAGLKHSTMKKIVKKMIRVESSHTGYHAHNKKSGAYGRYQILPTTAKYYSKKLRIPYSQWKRPANQDRIFQAILKDNILSLKRNKIKISGFSIYGAHQQGANGFKKILRSKKLSKTLEKRLRRNLPKHLRSIHRNKLRATWMKYWKRKFA